MTGTVSPDIQIGHQIEVDINCDELLLETRKTVIRATHCTKEI